MKRLLLALAFAMALYPCAVGAQSDKMPPMKDAPAVSVVHPSPSPSPSAVPKKVADDDGMQPGRPLNQVALLVLPFGCYDASCARLSVTHNSRVDAGAAAVANNISGTQVAAFTYAALSTDGTAVSKADTVCPSEIGTNGLARHVTAYGTYTPPSVLNGAASYQLTYTWSATGSSTVAKICLLNASSSGTMLFETLLGSPVSVLSGDSVVLVWTVNL